MVDRDVALSESNLSLNGSSSLGDANGDGEVDIVDALVIAQYAEGQSPDPFLPENADVNCDDLIEEADAQLVADYYVGLIECFPCACMELSLEYDFINRRLDIYATYHGSDRNDLIGDCGGTTLDVPDTDISQGPVIARISEARLDGDDYFGTVTFSREQVEQMLARYPNGEVPMHIQLFSDDDGSNCSAIWSGEARVLADETVLTEIPVLTDDFEFQIGVVQVVPPGFSLDQQEVCTIHDPAWSGTGDVAWGWVSEDCAAEYAGFPQWTIRAIALTDLLHAPGPYTTVDNMTWPTNWNDDYAEPINIYSLQHVGEFWSDLLERHHIVDVDTRLKKNPSFFPHLLGPYAAEDTIASGSHADIKAFFRQVVEEHQIDLSPYHFIVYVHYQNDDSSAFNRSFASRTNSYNLIRLYNPDIMTNTGFLTIVHEMGHQMFGANDLYDGFYLQYPDGVPDPNVANFPLTEACIMAKDFAWEMYDDDTAYPYETDIYDPEEAALGISRWQTEDPANFVLCADTIGEIMNAEGDSIPPDPNPNCTLEEFYAQSCGDCTSENYLTCSRASP